jgi:poly(ADP-ribose) glycohydrolase
MCFQEEILFAIFPEMLVSRLITEELDDNECLFMIGCERFSRHSGYGNTFRFDADFVDDTARDNWNRRMRQVKDLTVFSDTNAGCLFSFFMFYKVC